jgi:hypothetical protein
MTKIGLRHKPHTLLMRQHIGLLLDDRLRKDYCVLSSSLRLSCFPELTLLLLYPK